MDTMLIGYLNSWGEVRDKVLSAVSNGGGSGGGGSSSSSSDRVTKESDVP